MVQCKDVGKHLQIIQLIICVYLVVQVYSWLYRPMTKTSTQRV